MTHECIILGQYEKFLNNPIEFLDDLSTQGPIHRINIYSKLPGWLITGYHEAKEILKDPRFCRDNYGLQNVLASSGCAFWDLTSTVHNMLNSDSVDHTRLRRLTTKPFTQSSVQNQEPWIRSQVQQLIKQIPLGEVIDLLPALAYPLSMIVICELLGVPEGTERDNFNKWTDIIFTPSMREQIYPASINIYQYITNLIKNRRTASISEDSTNLIDQLIIARYEGDKLSDEELFATITLLLIAGSETTRNLIGNLAIALGSSVELQDQIRTNPDLIPALTEEVLRNDGPFHTSMLRFVSEDAHIAGVDFKANDIVLISFLAANRDPKVYSDPATIQLNRNEPAHIGFGHGPHICLGANLAKLQATLLVEELLKYCKNISLVKPVCELNWRISNMIRGRTEIPVVLT